MGLASSSIFIPHQYVPIPPLFVTQTDDRLYYHVLHLEELEDYGFSSKPVVPIACLSEQDLLEDAYGHSNQEGLQE